ncbi:AraC family transcriptional regulator [Sphingomonas oligophenolica]
MCDVVDRHATEPRFATPISGLRLFRMPTSVESMHLFYNPRVCIILRGSKKVDLAGAHFDADPATFLIVTVDLPVSSRVFAAPDDPFHIALTLDLDRGLLAELLQRQPSQTISSTSLAGLSAAPMTGELLGAFARLLDLLDHPEDLDVLSPLLLREIHHRMLRSASGALLAQFAVSGSHLWQIAKATSWIRANFREAVSIETLAELAGMSVTSFHRHFKAVTMMTPIEYRTQLRLQEARRMLLSEKPTAAVAGLAVGYDSQSQFSRDYKRAFGAPPATDVARLKNAG